MKNLCTLFSLVIISTFLGCQQEEVENPEDSYLEKVEITSDFHKEHLGKITFMKDFVAIEEYSNQDMIQSFNLPVDLEGVDLTIRVFLGNTLTNYLKELAPELSISDLVSQGNYQFSFLVDEQLIYQENLHPGAGAAWTKNTFTTVCVPFISSKNQDSWGRFLWSKFMMRGGGQEALAEGSHLLRVEMRPYIETGKITVGDIIATGDLRISATESTINIDPAAIAIQEIENHSDWNLSDKQFDVDKFEMLNKKIVQKYYKDITSIVVLNEGKIQVEEYFNGYDRSSLHDTRSVGKSITGMLVGLAIDADYIKNEDQTLGHFYTLKDFKNYSQEKANITIKDLLTMTSSMDGSDMDQSSKGSEDNIHASDDWMNYTLNLANNPERTTTKSWDYFTGGIMILGDIIDKNTPQGIESFAQTALFTPLNITHYKWYHTPQGLAYGGGGLQLSSLDLAKFGQLYQNNGEWKGTQIIAKSWVEQSMHPHIELPAMGKGHYGYLLYSTRFSVAGQEHEVWYAAGNGGNNIYIFKDLPIVIVITATAYNTIGGQVQGGKIVENYILPAVL